MTTGTKQMSPLAEQISAMLTKGRKENEFIHTAFWGKEHWALLGYVETRCVDYKLVPKKAWSSLDRNHMRCDMDRHPQFANSANVSMFEGGDSSGGKKYPTRLAEGIVLPDHDDWDCLYDLEAAGLVGVGGTGINPVVKMTKKGNTVAAALRAHKTEGKNFADFRYDVPK